MTSGEARWFDTLYESSYQRLTLIVLARAQVDLTEAQEIVQEAFATAYAKRGTLELVANQEAWLCTVALNIARRRWRRRIISDRLMNRARRPAVPDLADVAAEHADRYRAIRGYRTGHPIGTVKSRLARGRAALADELAGRGRHAQSDTAPPTREGTPTT